MKEPVINMKRVLNGNLAWLSDDYEVGGVSGPTVTAMDKLTEARTALSDLRPNS